MTLYERLVLVLLFLFLIIFGGMFFISVDNTRVFLTNQLQVHAQDTATSLGLSLSNPYHGDDTATMLSMVDAIFEGGYYQAITINDMSGKLIIDRHLNENLKTVPNWFIHIFPLPRPSAQANLVSGWMHKGTITVTSNPGYAYHQLWKTTIDLFKWFIFIFLFSLIISYIFIRMLLRPLDRVVAQANAICNKEFPIQEKLPHTPELKLVTRAMNKMVTSVKNMLDEQSAAIEALHKQSYRDPVTNLGNRRFFELQLTLLMSKHEVVSVGGLLLLELQGLKEFNDANGYRAGDELIQSIAKVITTACRDLKENFVARLTGGTFAILFPDFSHEEIQHFSTALIHGVEQNVRSIPEAKDKILAHMGVATFTGQENMGQLLSVADMALRTAQTKGPYAYFQHEVGQLDSSVMRSATEWRAFLNEIIRENMINVQYQPVMGFSDRQIMHYEALMRIPQQDGTLLPAGIIIPTADRFGITYELDKSVIRQVMTHAKMALDQIPYVVNISPSTLTSDEMFTWIFSELKANPDIASRIIFEVSEYTAVNNIERVKLLIKGLNVYGSGMALDHFGRGFKGFGYLRSLPISYIKLDGSFMRDIENQDTQFFINFLTKIAHTLDIRVIAEFVENQKQLDMLKEFHLDGVQGLFLAPPAEG